jgi:hypothetical protein
MPENNEGMDLKTFVSTTMLEIVEGVEIAMKEAPAISKTAVISPGKKSDKRGRRQDVAFEVALTTQESAAKEGKLSLKVFGAGVGVGGDTSTENSTVSRVSFTVPIWMPYVEIE